MSYKTIILVTFTKPDYSYEADAKPEYHHYVYKDKDLIPITKLDTVYAINEFVYKLANIETATYDSLEANNVTAQYAFDTNPSEFLIRIYMLDVDSICKDNYNCDLVRSISIYNDNPIEFDATSKKAIISHITNELNELSTTLYKRYKNKQ